MTVTPRYIVPLFRAKTVPLLYCRTHETRCWAWPTHLQIRGLTVSVSRTKSAGSTKTVGFVNHSLMMRGQLSSTSNGVNTSALGERPVELGPVVDR